MPAFAAAFAARLAAALAALLRGSEPPAIAIAIPIRNGERMLRREVVQRHRV